MLQFAKFRTTFYCLFPALFTSFLAKEKEQVIDCIESENMTDEILSFLAKTFYLSERPFGVKERSGLRTLYIKGTYDVSKGRNVQLE